MATYRGTLIARPDDRYAVVVSRFNQEITERLLQGAQDALTSHGVPPAQIDTVWVPGAFEIPFAARLLATGVYAAVICLGAVIRGETPHFDYVAGAVTQGIARLASEAPVPVLFGVLTADTAEQARARAGGKAGNKGAEAALAALEMVGLTRVLPPPETVG
jgi:6,7-dimethyl-8-ribityllumazine synthase